MLTRYELLAAQHQSYKNSSAGNAARLEKLNKDYSQLLLAMRDSLASNLVDYDVTAMVCGLVLLVLVSITQY